MCDGVAGGRCPAAIVALIGRRGAAGAAVGRATVMVMPAEVELR
jgi:hypothetical protein